RRACARRPDAISRAGAARGRACRARAPPARRPAVWRAQRDDRRRGWRLRAELVHGLSVASGGELTPGALHRAGAWVRRARRVAAGAGTRAEPDSALSLLGRGIMRRNGWRA